MIDHKIALEAARDDARAFLEEHPNGCYLNNINIVAICRALLAGEGPTFAQLPWRVIPKAIDAGEPFDGRTHLVRNDIVVRLAHWHESAWLVTDMGPTAKFPQSRPPTHYIPRDTLLQEPSPSPAVRDAPLREALDTLSKMHLGDCPAAMDQLAHARAHIYEMRKLAANALSATAGKP